MVVSISCFSPRASQNSFEKKIHFIKKTNLLNDKDILVDNNIEELEQYLILIILKL